MKTKMTVDPTVDLTVLSYLAEHEILNDREEK